MSEIKNKILNGLELTSEDFFSISLGEVEDVEIIEYIIEEQFRWSILKRVILEVDNDRFFEVHYYAAATERQEDEFFEQIAIEVEKKEVKVHTWVPKEE